jgi:anti-anti-sigma factor
MEISVEKNNDVSVVNLEGSFDIASSEPFDEELTALMNGGERRILLDFTQVPFIASTGLRMLLKAGQRMKEEGGLLYLCNINDTVREVFSMTGFDKIFSVFDTGEAAMEEIQKG